MVIVAVVHPGVTQCPELPEKKLLPASSTLNRYELAGSDSVAWPEALVNAEVWMLPLFLTANTSTFA